MAHESKPVGKPALRNANLPIGAAGKANQEIGAPEIGAPGAGEARWHSRGYIPHFESAEAIQHVTFHLADSLPKEVVARLNEELHALPAKKQEVERRKRIEAWIDAGHGSCVLRVPEMARMVQECLLHFDAQRYRLLAWTVMPNHVHVLFHPQNGWTVSKIVASWKKFTARKSCDFRRAGSANLPIGSGDEDAIQENGVPNGVPSPVWHREYWDRYMRNERHLQQAMEYIHQNPVKAGLVAEAEMWPWGSAGRADRANRAIGDPAGGAVLD